MGIFDRFYSEVREMGWYMLNSLVVSLPTVVGIMALASLAGFGFGKLRFSGRDKFFSSSCSG